MVSIAHLQLDLGHLALADPQLLPHHVRELVICNPPRLVLVNLLEEPARRRGGWGGIEGRLGGDWGEIAHLNHEKGSPVKMTAIRSWKRRARPTTSSSDARGAPCILRSSARPVRHSVSWRTALPVTRLRSRLRSRVAISAPLGQHWAGTRQGVCGP